MPPRKHQQPSASAQALSEAEALQQRGERRKGQEAVPIFQQAVAKYQAALSLGLGPDDRQEACFGMGWCLQLCADAVLHAARALEDAQMSWSSEGQAQEAAADLYQRAAAAYQQVVDDSGQLREDAAVNCGNTLCLLAELLSEAGGSGAAQDPAAAERACLCYQEAVQRYKAALAQDEDAATWGNLADGLMELAQLLAEGPLQGSRRQEAEATCNEALQAYERSCSLCDSTQGDDLPGLLCNWGSGLLAAAQMTADLPARRAFLAQAEARLRHSADFAQADAEPLIRLGDTLVAQAELVQQQGQVQEAAQLLQRALQEGYGQALAINRSNVEALLGTADAQASLAKLATGAGELGQSQQLWHSCLEAYSAALRAPSKLGSLRERCDVRFNHACALALSGKEEESSAILRQLLECRGIRASELAADADLEAVRNKPWFQQLLASSQMHM